MKKLTYFIEINRYNFPEWPMPTISFLFVFLSINLLYVSSAQQTFRDSIAFESNQTGTLNNYSPMSQLNYAF